MLASFHLFSSHTLYHTRACAHTTERLQRALLESCSLKKKQKRERHLDTHKIFWSNLSVSIWVFKNIGRSFCEFSSTKMSHLPYQDHSQSTFLSYRILNYWKFINCWIYNNLCLYVTEKWFKSQHLEYDNGAEQFLTRKQFCSCVWLVTLIYCVKMVTLFP